MSEAFAFFNSAELQWHEPFEGVRRQVITGRHVTMCLYHLKKGLKFPQHQHPQEQMAYVIKGSVEFTIGEREEKKGNCLRTRKSHSIRSVNRPRACAKRSRDLRLADEPFPSAWNCRRQAVLLRRNTKWLQPQSNALLEVHRGRL